VAKRASRKRTYLKAKRLEFFARVRDGELVTDAAAGVGVPQTVGSSWLRQCGGVLPRVSVQESGYRRLSIEEREKILAGMERNESIRAIARSISRAPSTVKREIDNNLYEQRYLGQRRSPVGAKRRLPWRYSPHHAQLRAERKASRRTPTKLATNSELRVEVQNRLREEHSPEQIAWRLRDEFPDRPEMWVSHETIYQALYVQGRGELRRDLHKRLRTGRAVRKPHRQDAARRSRILNMVSISERPAEVEDRAVPGHWEGDLIMGSTASNSAIGTLVERTTRYVMLLHLPNGHGADAVAEAMVTSMSRLPEDLRRTLTWDQGIEMANHARIAAATDLDIYFCDPHSPWQRGSNENTNGLLRQYFPKGTDLAVYQPDYLEHVARKLNNRPRKTLGWRTPAEKLDQLLSKPPGPDGVALAG
jgi:IS30 family transposase